MISEIMATGASQQQLEAEVRLCCIIQVKMWPIENKVRKNNLKIFLFPS